MGYIDYYEILGVPKNATHDEIRRSYRTRARKYHPDLNKDKGAESEFKKINEAYEVLRDPEKRKLYDRYGQNWQHVSENKYNSYWDQMFRNESSNATGSRTYRFNKDGSFGETEGFSDFFGDLFGNRFNTRNQDYHDFNRAGRSQEAEITVTLQDILKGSTKSISLQSSPSGSSGLHQPANRTFQVKLPKGITEGSTIRLSGQGEKGYGQGPSGDLLLRIHIAKDSKFKVNGYDIHTIVNVSPWEAALGAKIEIQTIDGSVTLAIPKASQNGKKLRIRGKGLPTKGTQAGDLIVELQIRMPPTLTGEEEQLFKELSAKSRFNPRLRGGQKPGK